VPSNRFHRSNDAIEDRHRLPDVEAAQGAHNFEGQCQVFQLCRSRRGAGLETFSREGVFEHRNRIDNANSVGFDFTCDRSEHRVIAEATDFSSIASARASGAKESTSLARLMPPAICGFTHVSVLQNVDHALQFTDF